MSGGPAGGARFEGSYMGAAGRISAAAVMECKICWTPYDPAEGDETRQVPPGTPFRDLPEDWKCPVCDGAREQFMVLRDEGRSMASAVAALVAEFREIHNARMRDVPFANRALHVEAVGFQPWEGCFLGVLVTPWCMNLTLLPGDGMDWSGLRTGAKETIRFPSGEYEFLHAVRPGAGPYKGCSLFSPMEAFASQLQAGDVARAVLVALLDPAGGEPRPEAAAPAPAAARAPSRRAFLGAPG